MRSEYRQNIARDDLTKAASNGPAPLAAVKAARPRASRRRPAMGNVYPQSFGIFYGATLLVWRAVLAMIFGRRKDAPPPTA